jgi:hypothetical protein
VSHGKPHRCHLCKHPGKWRRRINNQKKHCPCLCHKPLDKGPKKTAATELAETAGITEETAEQAIEKAVKIVTEKKRRPKKAALK